MNSHLPRQPLKGAPGKWITPSQCDAFAHAGVTAHRLYSGADAWLERLGEDILLSYKTEAARDAVLAEWQGWSAAQIFVPRRIFGRFLPEKNEDRAAPALLSGDPAASLETVVEENHVRFALDFAAGYSAGLFIDQRANRAFVRQAGFRRLLNTFAYTCSFSVVAALAGAETVSVDLSQRSLARGEENFRRNKLDPKAGHKFIADDVLAVLPRLARRGEKFDTVILDPPTFSRNQAGGAFQVQRDFDRLVELALEVAAPSAKILLSVNHSEMRVADLERAARNALRMQKRSGRFQPSPPPADFPSGHGAKTVWLELNG